MKLHEIKLSPNVIAYDVTSELGDMSLNNDDGLSNRLALAKLLNTDLNHMVAPRQTHTTNFKEVYLKDGGSNMEVLEDKLVDIDATYTKDQDLYLLSFHADCTPVLLYDNNIVCAIHAGWLGTVNQIVSKVVKHLIINEGCNPKTMKAYIGPSISKDSFEVMQDVVDKVKKMDIKTDSYIFKTDDVHYHVDNKGLNKAQLLNLGLLEENIEVSDIDTMTSNDYFSYRRDHDSRRNITIIKRI
ncbi:MAG: peptidoglycan editing factor PgeF [Thomasclavelia sp.]|nr:peptidoglycan editing factor PgeF [Thomasclavelia sp.]